jgi:hypothetical protein
MTVPGTVKAFEFCKNNDRMTRKDVPSIGNIHYYGENEQHHEGRLQTIDSFII